MKMKKYKITYVHNSQKQTIRIEAEDENEANHKFKQIAPDVPEGNVLSVVDLSRKEILIRKLMVSVAFTLIGFSLYMYFERGLFAALGGGIVLIGIAMILLELLAIFRLKK